MRTLIVPLALAVLATTSSCKDRKSDSPALVAAQPAAGSATAAPRQDDKSNVSPNSIRLEPRQLPGMSLTAAFIAGQPVKESSLGVAQSAQQQYGPVLISVWRGPNSTIDNWRLGFANLKGAELGDPEEIELCGRKAIKQTAVVPGIPGGTGHTMTSIPLKDGTTVAEAVKIEHPQAAAPLDGPPVAATSAGKGSRETPSRTIALAAIATEEGGATFAWSIHTNQRAAFKSHEDAFFASIACE